MHRGGPSSAQFQRRGSEPLVLRGFECMHDVWLMCRGLIRSPWVLDFTDRHGQIEHLSKENRPSASRTFLLWSLFLMACYKVRGDNAWVDP